MSALVAHGTVPREHPEAASVAPGICTEDTHVWPGEMTTVPRPCECGAKTASVEYVRLPREGVEGGTE